MPQPPHWTPKYWLYAAALPVCLFALDAVQLTLYTVKRAPNVHVLVHIGLMWLIYGLWIFVPRLIFEVSINTYPDTQKLMLRLVGLGILLSGIHLFLLAFILRLIFSPPGWNLSHLIISFGEVWLGNIGLWALACIIAVALVVWTLKRNAQIHPTPTRFEVRQNGKTFSIPITDIYWIKAAGNYAELYTKTGIYTVRQTLKEVREHLPENLFLSSHRSALVNSQHVILIAPNSETGSYSVLLTDNHEAPLSRRSLTPFKTLLKSTP